MTEGLTDLVPDVCPEVEKPPPVHEVALVEDHESVEERPCGMVVGDAFKLAETGR